MNASSPRNVSASADERKLVRRLIRGDERAFEEFSEAYIPALHRFVSYRLNHDHELTRDIVQTTLIKAIRKLPSYRGEAALMTWLCAYCKTEISAHFRRARRRPAEVGWTGEPAAGTAPLHHTPPDGPEKSVLRNEVAALVHAALDRLPPRYGQVLEWKYLDNLPVKEIADRLRLRAKAAESLLTRARVSFRETYARMQVGPDHE